MSLIFLILAIDVVSSQIILISSQAPSPRIILYSESGCRGNQVGDHQGSATFPLDQYPFSSYRLTELWLIQPCSSSNKIECEVPLPRKGINICINEDYQFQYAYLHLSRLSDDLVQNKINFYSGPRLNGTHDSLTTDIPRRDLIIHSLFFTGNYSWTIYTGEEYTGTGYCIPAGDDVKESGYGVTMRVHLNVRMRSLRQGCHSESILPSDPDPIDDGENDNEDDSGANGLSISLGMTMILLVLAYSLH